MPSWAIAIPTAVAMILLVVVFLQDGRQNTADKLLLRHKAQVEIAKIQIESKQKDLDGLVNTLDRVREDLGEAIRKNKAFERVFEGSEPRAVKATVYEPLASQTDDTPFQTASLFEIIPHKVHEQRIIAVSRDMLLDFPYGTRVYVMNAGEYTGFWTVEDTMNARYRNTIDFCVPIGSVPHMPSFKNALVYKV